MKSSTQYLLVIILCLVLSQAKAQNVFEPKIGVRLLGYGDTLHLANYTQLTLQCTWLGPHSWQHSKLFCNGIEVQPNCTPNEYDILYPGFYNIKLKHQGATYMEFHFFVKQ